MSYAKKIIVSLVALATPALAWAGISDRQAQVLAPSLQVVIESATTDRLFDVLVSLEGSAASQRTVDALAVSHGMKDRYQTVARHLHERSESVAAQFATATAEIGVGRIEIVRRFWISETVHIRADREALLALAARDDIALIAPNAEIELTEPVLITEATESTVGAEQNLDAVGARALWAMGLTGAGRLVASIDTGVEGIHPALIERWRGQSGDTAAAWFDPFNGAAPADINGHGTHVMGVMVGRDGSDTIGVAPDAEWITAGVIDRGSPLAATFADILAALEWATDPDGNPATTDDVPDVICNSWGVPQYVINACDTLFFAAIDNVEAMGIVCVFAAGNEGPFSSTIRNPADRGSSPTASFAVGSVDSRDPAFSVPSFSSRGPSACDGFSIKPEMTAPGVSIRSSYKGQSYKSISGTSMSAPHVAAGVALLRQYNPDLTPEEIKLALLESARDVGAPGEDNATGHGLLDLVAALAAVRAPAQAIITVSDVRPDADGDAILRPGEIGPLTVTLTGSGADAEDLLGVLKPLTAGVTVTQDTAIYGTLKSGETIENSGAPFMISLAADLPVGDSAWFELRLSAHPYLGDWVDTIGVLTGLPAGADLRDVTDGDGALTVSNFGHLGLGEGSIMDAGGQGWRQNAVGGNLLYEAALMIGAADGSYADASRDSDGRACFDFVPLDAPTQMTAALSETVWYDDSRATWPVGVEVAQTGTHHLTTPTYSVTIVSWTIRSRSGLPIDGLRIGWLTDIDFPGVGSGAEKVFADFATGGFYHSEVWGGTEVAGIVPLGFAFDGLQYFDNGSGTKRVFSASEKQTALAAGVAVAPTGTGDFLEILSVPAINLGAGDSVVVALAFVSGASAGDFATGGSDARHIWAEITDVSGETGNGGLPADYQLGQNYPNPFNAATVIPVTVGAAGAAQVSLDIFDILGRRVATLHEGSLAPGTHHLIWDGTGRDGSVLATGVYLARLVIDGNAQIRRMVLLK
jgi:subtilisin family serine protease